MKIDNFSCFRILSLVLSSNTIIARQNLHVYPSKKYLHYKIYKIVDITETDICFISGLLHMNGDFLLTFSVFLVVHVSRKL